MSITRPVLVTGATGTVGRALVELLLERQIPVRVLTRNCQRASRLWPGQTVECHEGDLLDDAVLSAACAGTAGVFHLASYQPGAGVADPESGPEHHRVTIEGTRGLLRVLADDAFLVFASSIRVIDGSNSDYALAKQAAEKLVMAASLHHVAVLRLPPVYGDMGTGIVAAILRGVATERFKTLPDFGEKRSLVHKHDAARALLMLATSNRAHRNTYTLTDGVTYSLRSIYESVCDALEKPARTSRLPRWAWYGAALVGSMLESVTGRPMPVTWERLKKMRTDAWFDGVLIREQLGFVPELTLRQALPDMVAEFRSENVAR